MNTPLPVMLAVASVAKLIKRLIASLEPSSLVPFKTALLDLIEAAFTSATNHNPPASAPKP